jgi:hypothetical protein
MTTTAAKKNEKMVRRLEREWKKALRREEESTDLATSWRLAARSDSALRQLEAARAGREIPAPRTKRNLARGGFAALAVFGRAVARALSAQAGLVRARAVLAAKKVARLAAAAARRVVATVATLALNNVKKEEEMKNEGEFEVGEMVRSRVTAQGMVKGEAYEVRHVSRRRTFAGTFTTYGLTGRSAAVEGVELSSVGNGHLLLERA